MTKRTYNEHQDAALAALEIEGRVAFHQIRTVAQLNAMRDLCKLGHARFARFPRECWAGYILVGHPLLDEVA